MLYVTTRNDRDPFTAQRVLHEKCCENGGMYLPFKAPQFSSAEIEALLEKPFNSCVAEIINILFNTHLTGWDVDFNIGRYPVRLAPLGHRIFVAECWHNPEWHYEYLVKNLTACLLDENIVLGDWTKIAVRIAVLFGIYSELRRSGIILADLAVVSGDFSAPISAWYARQWGLPIGNIICCCNENNTLWDLICHGQMRTNALSIRTELPEADVTLPDDLERLVYECGGIPEVNHYLETCSKGGIYCPSDAVLSKMRNGLFVSVVSTQRIRSTIPNVYSSHGYFLSLSSALTYSGLLDYRTKSGETRDAVILSDKNVVCDLAAVSNTLGISENELRRQLI